MLRNLKVVTFNVWGIRYFSKDVSIRYSELIKALLISDYDIVALQEVWSQSDYYNLKKNLTEKFPYSNYFHSGIIGSGCCIFSKHEIVEIFQSRYSVNGTFYKFHHGDWFGGKSVGLACIKYFDLNLSVYVTHLHANYSADESSDEYLAHRISQAFELSQFIAHTSAKSDLVLLMGDLNWRPYELGFKILRDNSFLLDTFIEAKSVLNCNSEGATCNVPTNSYLNMAEHKIRPNGCRIDYILYKFNDNMSVHCLKHELCFGRIPDRNINYSDHEGVSAEFAIMKSENGKIQRTISMQDYINQNEEIKSRLKGELIEAYNKIDTSIESLSKNKFKFTLLGLLSFVLLFLFNEYMILTLVKTVFLLLIFLFSIWFIIIDKSIEEKHLKSVRNSMKFLLKSRYNHSIKKPSVSIVKPLTSTKDN